MTLNRVKLGRVGTFINFFATVLQLHKTGNLKTNKISKLWNSLRKTHGMECTSSKVAPLLSATLLKVTVGVSQDIFDYSQNSESVARLWTGVPEGTVG